MEPVSSLLSAPGEGNNRNESVADMQITSETHLKDVSLFLPPPKLAATKTMANLLPNPILNEALTPSLGQQKPKLAVDDLLPAPKASSMHLAASNSTILPPPPVPASPGVQSSAVHIRPKRPSSKSPTGDSRAHLSHSSVNDTLPLPSFGDMDSDMAFKIDYKEIPTSNSIVFDDAAIFDSSDSAFNSMNSNKFESTADIFESTGLMPTDLNGRGLLGSSASMLMDGSQFMSNNLPSPSEFAFADQDQLTTNPSVLINLPNESLPSVISPLTANRFFSIEEALNRLLDPSSEVSTQESIEKSSETVKFCKTCSQKIETRALFSNGHYFHFDCFTCSGCNTKLNETDGCFQFRDQILCRECYSSLEEPRTCRICSEVLTPADYQIQIGENDHIHQDCFRCHECSSPLDVSCVHQLEGNYFCPVCADRISQTVCDYCEKPIIGIPCKHNGKMFHKDHFRCDECDVVLKGNNFVSHHNKFYCTKHGSMMLNSCHYCKKIFSGAEDDRLKWRRKYYHPRCFVCRICGEQLKTTEAKSVHGRPNCAHCFSYRIQNGECTQTGRTLVSHRHTPSKSDERRTKMHEETGKELILPEYTVNKQGIYFYPIEQSSVREDNFEPMLEDLTRYGM